MLLALAPSGFVHRLFTRDARVLVARPRVTRWQAVHVPHGTTVELPPARGQLTVHCRTGEAWMTHDGDPRDVFLRATECHRVDNAQRLTVHALRGDCALEMQVECAGKA